MMHFSLGMIHSYYWALQSCPNYYHVYELLSPFNRVIIPFRDPINRPMILFAPILVLFTPTLALPHQWGGEILLREDKRESITLNT